MAPPHGILARNMVVPPLWWALGVCASRGKGWVGCAHLGDYFSLSPGLSHSIWSHTSGSWYLLRFLFKDVSLALMYMASFMCLVVPWVSLWTMLKQSGLTGCPVERVCRWMGRRPWDTPWIYHQRLPVSPMYSTGHLMVGHLYWYMTLLFVTLESLSLGAVRRSLMVLDPLKCTWMLFLLQVLLIFFLIPVCREPPCRCFCCCCWWC